MAARSSRYLRVALGAFGLAFLALNVLAWRHAGRFLSYVDAPARTPPPEGLSTWQRVGVLLNGVTMTRPRNTRAPARLSPPARPERLRSGDGSIEIWWQEVPAPRGTVLLFPGYAEAKLDLVPDAEAWHALGFRTGLVDLRGAGGSSGSEFSLGFREAEDVRAAADAWAAAGRPGGRLVLYGHSMGGAAALRAVAELGVTAEGVVAVSVFDRMRNAIRERFRAMHAPFFPAGDLLVFWGGVRRGFNGFALNPADYAARSRIPLLVLHGGADVRAPAAQGSNIAARAAGPVRMELFPGAGHESLVSHDPARWRAAVSNWVDTLPPP